MKRRLDHLVLSGGKRFVPPKLMQWSAKLLHPLDRDRALVESQTAALARHVPTLYGVVILCCGSLATLYHGQAPLWLADIVPGVLITVALFRMFIWMLTRRRPITAAVAVRRLGEARMGMLFMGFGTGIWVLCLTGYGDALSELAAEMIFTVAFFACVVSLGSSLPSSATLLGVAVAAPFLLTLLLRAPNQAMRLAAFCALLALFVITQILLLSASDFVALILSARELRRRQEETQKLLNDNFVLANTDALTGLPNRRSFFDTLKTELNEAALMSQAFAVALLDLDRFKWVNDIYGHGAGDRLLIEVAERLRGLAGPHLFLARLGGDEFGIILTSPEVERAVTALGESVTRILAEPFLVGEQMSEITCSIGVAMYPRAGATAENLFECADYALYHGKQTTKGGLVIFSREHETRIRAASRAEQSLRAANLDEELWVAFQPIVEAASGRVVAFEALARWQSPELGPVSPSVFIPMAERSQLIGRLTRVVLAKALAAAKTWPSHIHLSFNLSSHNLTSDETMAAIETLVRENGLDPARIEFEVTESAVLQDFEQAQSRLLALRALGARVALDDFGTGYSSLGYVNRLKLDKIKVDRSFVTDVHANKVSAKIMRTIIALCRILEVDCVVEGVETEEQMHTVVMLGCRFIQGFFFAKPVTREMVPQVIERIEGSGGQAKRGRQAPVPLLP